MIYGKRNRLGLFTGETEPGRACNEAAVEHVCKYAHVNIIDEYNDVSEHMFSEDVSEEESC